MLWYVSCLAGGGSLQNSSVVRGRRGCTAKRDFARGQKPFSAFSGSCGPPTAAFSASLFIGVTLV